MAVPLGPGARALRLLFAVALALHAGRALADDVPVDVPDVVPEPYWSLGPARPFLAVTLEGSLYARATVAAGYGKPNYLWGGVEAYATVTGGAGSLYAGLRAALRAVDLSLGVRRTWAWSRRYAPEATAHALADFDGSGSGPAAQVTMLDGSVAGGVPLLHGFGLWELSWLHVFGAPPGYEFYEEIQHVVVRPPDFGAARLGYVASLGRGGFFNLGAMGELDATSRAGVLARAGPVVFATLTPHLDLTLFFTFAVRSPDELGLLPGAYGTLRLRWRSATCEPGPRFP